MAALIKAVGRLVVMALVVIVVVATATYAGLAATVAVGLAIVVAGIVGMAGKVRRRRAPDIDEPIEHPTVVAMAPESAVAAAVANDPEAAMPRWRRPSLLAARRADASRGYGVTERAAMHFTPDTAPTTAELRVVRYAVVPLLDRPDEVMGMQVMDLIVGDEVQVTESTGPYWEVVCPDGERGWVHRTTLSLPGSISVSEPIVEERVKPGDAEDVLSALLAARGLN
jgi:hypothetical protein